MSPLLFRFQGGGECLSHALLLSLFYLGSTPGTLVCWSLRFRRAYWAAPSTTRCDASLPSPSTLSSLLPSLCRGLMPSMSSTSTWGTAARRCARSWLLWSSSLWPLTSHPATSQRLLREAEAPDAQPRGPRLCTSAVESRRQEERGVRVAQPLHTTQLLIDRLKSPLAFSLWECPALIKSI